MHRLIILLLFFIALQIQSTAQRLIEIINQTEKAVLHVKTFSPSGTLLSETTGFVISSDGMAIVPAEVFYQSDSVLVETRNGRSLAIQRVLQVNPIANLSLIKLNVSRQREFNYLIPSREIFTEKQEVLIFSHPKDPGNGISYTSVNKIKQQLIINRTGLCEAKLGPKSFGAPIIDNRGNLIGINASNESNRASCIFSTALLSDTNWVDVNLSPTEIKTHPGLKNTFTPEIWQGMFKLLWLEADQAARLFSSAIRKNPNMALLYVLRGQARYLYRNLPGCTEDFDSYLKLKPNGYITFYLQGLHLLEQNKKQEAFHKFLACLTQKPNFAPALVEKGKIELYQRRNGTEALRNFASAIAADTLFADGYYERAKLSYQNEITSRTLENDLNKAIELNPDLPGVYTLRGNIRLRAENYLPALSDYDRAIEKDAKDSHAYFSRGIVNYNIGMKDKACNDWEKAGSLGHFKAVKFMSEYCNSSSRRY